MDARRIRIDETQAWALLRGAGSIAVAKGKKIQRFESIPAEKNAILKRVVGPSGNLRAPTYWVEDESIKKFLSTSPKVWLVSVGPFVLAAMCVELRTVYQLSAGY